MMKLSADRLRGARAGIRAGSRVPNGAFEPRDLRCAWTRLGIHRASRKHGNYQKRNIRSAHDVLQKYGSRANAKILRAHAAEKTLLHFRFPDGCGAMSAE